MRGVREAAVVCALLAASLLACTPALPKSGSIAPGDYVRHMDERAGGFRRAYRFHVPRTLSADARVVVVLHGAYSTARGIEQRSGFSRLADEAGFVVVYPEGYGFFNWFRHWNAGHCCGRALELGIDDVGFLDRVIEDVARVLPVDASRVYVVGESNGAMLAYLYAAKRSERVAALAAVIGAIGSGPSGQDAIQTIPAPSAPVPVVIIHGDADQVVPYAGGSGTRRPEIAWASVADAVSFWVEHDGAKREPGTEELYGGGVTHSVWHAKPGGASVALYAVHGWPHRWPAANDDTKLDAARAIWEFFETISGRVAQ
jgi:polyhydroxybutyrate depolymerase